MNNDEMAIVYKDIGQLSQKSTIAGTEKIPVSDTEFVTTQQIASLAGGGGSTTDCVHKTGDETVGGDKTFTDNIEVVDASHILYSGASPSQGFTRGTRALGGTGTNTISFDSLEGEPKAFIVNLEEGSGSGVLMIVGDSTGVRGIYNTGNQHNYSANFTKSYSNGTLTITAPSGVTFVSTEQTGYYDLVYYYGDGSLTFKTSTIQPGSGVTAVTLTGTDLTEVPAMYAIFLESSVNNETYRRVAAYTNSAAFDGFVEPLGITFLTGGPVDTTSSFSVSYSNGLVINSGGTNAGGYFHNPGTYTLYYLMASDIGGGGGSYQSLSAELSAITTDITTINTSLSGKEATSNKVTSLSAQSTDTQYPSAKLVYDQLALKQAAITISSSEPTQYQGNNGDIWIVI